MSKDWIIVSKDGLGKQAALFSKGRLLSELVQNAFDEDGVTKVTVKITPIPYKAHCRVEVEDNCPDGFKDLTHAYTLFAASAKAKNPQQRGRFNFGEKLVLSLCAAAEISTTTGKIVFREDGTREEFPRQKTTAGSIFSGVVKMKREEIPSVVQHLNSLIAPPTIEYLVEGVKVEPKKKVLGFDAQLETVTVDEEGVFRPTVRKTNVELYNVAPGETPQIFELGIPVVEICNRWHINVCQKIPLNRDRDNVKPSFLRELLAHLLNNTASLLDPEQANSTWVKEAVKSNIVTKDAFKKVIINRFGEKAAIYDPSDREANQRWQSEQGTIVHGRMLSKNEWDKVREYEVLMPAGQLRPSPKPYDPSGTPVEVLEESEYTPAIRAVVNYAKYLGLKLLDGKKITVRVVKGPRNFRAAYGPGSGLDLSITSLGHRWFDSIGEHTDSLLIHEFGHDYCDNHLSEDYYKALCSMAARLKRVAMEEPHVFKHYERLCAGKEQG